MRKVDAHDYIYGAVHEGFYRTLFRKRRNRPNNFYQELVNDIEHLVKRSKLDNSNSHVWVTGHSLGAALATLFFARATKTKEIKGIEIGDGYTFGSPHVGNLEFRNRFISYDNAPYYNTARLYRVFNINDPVPHVPFGFDDPNVLAISKGPSGLDSVDYIHVGVPVLLHQHPYSLPDKEPDFIVETPKDLAIYLCQTAIYSSGISNLLEFAHSWRNVLNETTNFLKERSFESASKVAVMGLETTALVVNHSPSTYCRNLSVKADYNL